ncbi:MAG: ABC transporter ATP-binding protein [Thiotrichaceae bacterium]|nr:ABC transporter ATP-binding protein [Thiotrichaceae bacterium]
MTPDKLIHNIKLNNIHFTRNKNSILNDLNIELSSNNFILMTGQNGSGKSTFLKVLSGLLKPDSISMSYQQKPSVKAQLKTNSWFSYKKFLRRHFCYLHQTPFLFNATVYDNVAYGLKHKKLAKDEIEDKVNEALKVVSLEHLYRRKSHALSGGEQQRVAIARSWVIRPAFMLLDEPFANMDKHSRHSTYDTINQLKEENIGIILTSHDPFNGELAFNRHLHLYQGKMNENSI